MNYVKLQTDYDRKISANPLIFGHFIEFMRDCIDKGIWAELLRNRSFDYEKIMHTGKVNADKGVAAEWMRTGNRNSFEFSLDSANSLCDGGCSQKIRCFNDYDGFVGIRQGNIKLSRGSYCGHIWIKAQDRANIEICIHTEEKVILSVTKPVHAEWEKYDFKFNVNRKTADGNLEIRLLGTGTIWLDGASLMPELTVKGIWKDTFQYIKRLKPTILRFPGGCFADCYHWENGIGDQDRRPSRINEHWGGIVDNSFGTDEYIELCRLLHCEPMICINFGSGSPQEAANWVEYCNGSPDTVFGKLRSKNGHPDPYNVKYWDIGNEAFGDWEIGHCTAQQYTEKYLKFYQAMKKKDDRIFLLACGGDGDSYSQEWNEQILNHIDSHLDAVNLHMYVQKSLDGCSADNKEIYYATVGAVEKYEEIILNLWKIIQSRNSKAKIAVTEYNLGTLIDSYREQTFEAAAFIAGMLNMFLRNSDKLAICNFSDLVNGWPGGCIVKHDDHIYGTISYYVLKMYAESDIKEVLQCEISGQRYDVSQKVGNVEPLKEVPYTDILVCHDNKNRTVYFVVNRSLNEAVSIDMNEKISKIEILTVHAEKSSDMNKGNKNDIRPIKYTQCVKNGKVVLEPLSVNKLMVLG